jgi:hypothetical protein
MSRLRPRAQPIAVPVVSVIEIVQINSVGTMAAEGIAESVTLVRFVKAVVVVLTARQIMNKIPKPSKNPPLSRGGFF